MLVEVDLVAVRSRGGSLPAAVGGHESECPRTGGDRQDEESKPFDHGSTMPTIGLVLNSQS